MLGPRTENSIGKEAMVEDEWREDCGNETIFSPVRRIFVKFCVTFCDIYEFCVRYKLTCNNTLGSL